MHFKSWSLSSDILTTATAEDCAAGSAVVASGRGLVTEPLLELVEVVKEG